MSWDISVSKLTGYGFYDWGLITRRDISVGKVIDYGLGDDHQKQPIFFYFLSR